MRTFLILTASLAVLSSCAKESEMAEKRYKMVERNGGTKSELCEESRKVSDAYLKEGDEKSYRLWKGLSASTCTLAQYK